MATKLSFCFWTHSTNSSPPPLQLAGLFITISLQSGGLIGCCRGHQRCCAGEVELQLLGIARIACSVSLYSFFAPLTAWGGKAS